MNHSSHAISSHQGAGDNSDEFDEIIPSPQSCMTYSPGTAEYHQVPSPPDFMHSSHPLSSIRDAGGREVWFDPQNLDWDLNGSAFFWTQLQKEESHLRGISDAVLLNTDGHGRT